MGDGGFGEGPDGSGGDGGDAGDSTAGGDGAARCLVASEGGIAGDIVTLTVGGDTVSFADVGTDLRQASTVAGTADHIRVQVNAFDFDAISSMTVVVIVPFGTASGTLTCEPPPASGLPYSPISVRYIDSCGGSYSSDELANSCTAIMTAIPVSLAGGRLEGTFSARLTRYSGQGPFEVTATGTLNVTIGPAVNQQ